MIWDGQPGASNAEKRLRRKEPGEGETAGEASWRRKLGQKGRGKGGWSKCRVRRVGTPSPPEAERISEPGPRHTGVEMSLVLSSVMAVQEASVLGMLKANNTETRTTDLGGMLESSGPTILQTWKLRPRERKGLAQDHMVEWQSQGLCLALELLGQKSFHNCNNSS